MLRFKPDYLAADTAYGSAETLNWVVNEKRIAPHIPVVDKSGREDGSLSRGDSTFDKARNVYICPQGKLLHTIKGLGFGADNYMTKPFHKDELVARIHAIVRRSKEHAQSIINTDDRCVNLGPDGRD